MRRSLCTREECVTREWCKDGRMQYQANPWKAPFPSFLFTNDLVARGIPTQSYYVLSRLSIPSSYLSHCPLPTGGWHIETKLKGRCLQATDWPMGLDLLTGSWWPMDATCVVHRQELEEMNGWKLDQSGATAQVRWSPSAMSLLPDHRRRTVWCGDALVCSENAGTQSVWLVVACPPWPTAAEPRFSGAASSVTSRVGLEPIRPTLCILVIIDPPPRPRGLLQSKSFFLVSLQGQLQVTPSKMQKDKRRLAVGS